MYKKLSIVLLLTAFWVFSSRSTALAASSSASPLIVKRVLLKNQTGPIPSTTIFTPSQTGFFRVSVYMTPTTVDSTIICTWGFSLDWFDDAGEQFGGGTVIACGGESYSWSTTLIEATAGKPVKFAVTQGGFTGANGATYELFFIVEKI